jgi:hypothetical protein
MWGQPPSAVQPSESSALFLPEVTSVAEQFAEKLDCCSVLKGRGFSRAVGATKSVVAFSH